MLLNSIVKELDFVIIQGNINREVSSIAYDSREVIYNSIFVAITGFTVDGHNYIEKAIEKGATTIVVEKDIDIDENITVLKVKSSRKALALISANYFSNPTEKLNLIGITGTNGKTSTTYFIKSILDYANKATGIIGTIGTVIDNKLIKTKNTTPESLNLQQIFSEMVEADTENCIMEVSSHALSLSRVAYCSFNTGIFTNLSPDHLELHKTMEEYFNAKAQLFELTTDYNIVNIDDEYGKKLAARIKNYDAKLVTFGIEDASADIYATKISCQADNTTYVAHTPKGSVKIKVKLPGIINVYNSLAAIACAYCNNISLQDIKEGINGLERIKGRFETVYQDNDYKVIVDFAHTEDGLEKALTTIKPFAKGRIILVFGVYAAAGEMGKEKRRSMGKVAVKYADFAVVTSDNPKDQDPNLIIRDIVEAIEEEGGSYQAIIDRREAINFAINLSKKGDIILITGKGHETSQIIGKEEIPFSEAEIVNEIMQKAKELRIS
ncbi:MAG: UDP-N-acetylmuramoyl-L-alanyl-D-glutamate--2,6-diaminopimelate ligase [Bacillota bacterium]|nr:UDP-N-acetylmuramoyl-L-alanyl-D-glutamate--2,6-diaminopimelate ligase [Bacillota bacterium]